jgi:hypothetical protein
MVARAWSAATAKRFEVTAAIFSPPGCGGAYPTTAAHRRHELARQLNHLPASATNE